MTTGMVMYNHILMNLTVWPILFLITLRSPRKFRKSHWNIFLWIRILRLINDDEQKTEKKPTKSKHTHVFLYSFPKITFKFLFGPVSRVNIVFF